MVDKKDKIETLNERPTEVRDKFIELKKSGIDPEILEIYLQHKTKLSRKKIKNFIEHLDEFYHKLIKTKILEELEQNEPKV